MPDTCIRRRLLFACRQTYQSQTPGRGTEVGWEAAPMDLSDGPNDIDRALVGRVGDGIVLAFRGTLAPFVRDEHGSGQVGLDWINNVEFLSSENPVYPGRVHRGFARSVDGLWPRLLPAIQALIRPGGPNALYVTGHSKGGALANLAAWRALGIAGLEAPIRVYTIAAARAGNEDFGTAYTAHGGIRCHRYEVAIDVVPYAPLGGDAPRWVKAVARRLWPHLADDTYAPVGTRVLPRITRAEASRVLVRYLGGLGFGGVRGGYLPLLASAHDIGPSSAYDTLICDGEPLCAHD
jgi:Lipase (class 3)